MWNSQILYTRDKSYYTDELAKITGKSREYWGKFGMFELRIILRKLIAKRRFERRYFNADTDYQKGRPGKIQIAG